MIITTLQMGFWGFEEESIGDKQVEKKKKKEMVEKHKKKVLGFGKGDYTNTES